VDGVYLEQLESLKLIRVVIKLHEGWWHGGLTFLTDLSLDKWPLHAVSHGK